MKPEKTRKADLLKKPLLPSRIPKKGDRSLNRVKQLGVRDLKRRFSALSDKTVSLVRSPHTEKESLDALLLTHAEKSDKEQVKSPAQITQPALSLPAQELVNLIPSLNGVDVSNLVASIKRRRTMQNRRGAVSETGSLQQRSCSTVREPQPLFPSSPRGPTDRTEEHQPQAFIPELESCLTYSTCY